MTRLDDNKSFMVHVYGSSSVKLNCAGKEQKPFFSFFFVEVCRCFIGTSYLLDNKMKRPLLSLLSVEE